MTEKQFLEMSDREKDELICEKIMGFYVLDDGELFYVENKPSNNFQTRYDVPHYTTSWEAMREVVEKFRVPFKWSMGLYSITHASECKMEWLAKIESFDKELKYDFEFATAESAPLAVALAALKAKGVIK